MTDSRAAVAFFDLFDLPLVTPEGFSFLPGRESVLERWQSAVRHIDRKLMIAGRACRILRWVPFVDAVFACNTVAIGNADDDSDIDVLVVVRDRRLWFTRLLVTAVLSIAGLRRHGKKIRDRVCLSFYLTPSAFELSEIAIPQPDIYLAYWLRTLIPLFDPENIFYRLQTANRWVESLVPPTAAFCAAPRIRTDATRASLAWRSFWERAWSGAYGDMLERQAKTLQRARMNRNTESAERRGGTGVVVSDTMMKFHEHDRRKQYQDEWRTRCEGLGFRV